MSKNIVIVGAGIAGIYAALVSKTLRPDLDVVLIEQSDEIGGLLASRSHGGYEFDYGTHVPRFTGNDVVDTLLFSDLNNIDWRRFQNINAGNVSLNGRLYTHSASPFIHGKNESQSGEWLMSLLRTLDKTLDSPDNLEKQLINLFGTGYVDSFFRPCIARKLGVDLAEMVPDTHKLIGLSRIIIGDEQMMRALKSDARLDSLLAFAHQSEGISEHENLYPSNGRGIGLWVEGLTKKMANLGVQIVTGCSIKHIEHTHGEIHSVELSDSSKLDVEHLCWCGPGFALLKAANVPFESQYRPAIRQTRLHHFVFNTPIKIACNYVDVNDPQFKSFRITLYSNLAGQSRGPFKCTVEVIEPQGTQASEEPDEILNELVDIGIIDNNPDVLYYTQDLVKAGFPIQTPGFKREVIRQREAAKQHLNNLSLLGKAAGEHFFMADVLDATHQEIVCVLANTTDALPKASGF